MFGFSTGGYQILPTHQVASSERLRDIGDNCTFLLYQNTTKNEVKWRASLIFHLQVLLSHLHILQHCSVYKHTIGQNFHLLKHFFWLKFFHFSKFLPLDH